MKNKLKPYIWFILLSLGVGAISAMLTKGNMDIYKDIINPPLAPPMWVFPVVWTVLYTLMGISAGRVYTEDKDALGIYYIQLIINFFWSIIFFNMRMFLFSAIWLVLLWAAVICMVIKFKKVSKWAAYLQLFYLLWIKFALYLNIAIYVLNK